MFNLTSRYTSAVKRKCTLGFYITTILVSLFYNCHPSSHFVIRNDSDASQAEIKALKNQLDVDLSLVSAFLGKSPPNNIKVTIDDTCEIPSARFGGLQLHHCHNRMPSEAIIHEIAHIVSGYDAPRVIQEGLAVYVDTSLSKSRTSNFPVYQLTLDDWMTIFLKKGTIIPLFDILKTSTFDFDTDGSNEDAKSWQIYVEAGAFVKWIIEKKGWDVFWKYYHDPDPVVIVPNASIQKIEDEWLEYVLESGANPKKCREAFSLFERRFKFWCDRVDPQ